MKNSNPYPFCCALTKLGSVFNLPFALCAQSSRLKTVWRGRVIAPASVTVRQTTSWPDWLIRDWLWAVELPVDEGANMNGANREHISKTQTTQHKRTPRHTNNMHIMWVVKPPNTNQKHFILNIVQKCRVNWTFCRLRQGWNLHSTHIVTIKSSVKSGFQIFYSISWTSI
jgi:hypothetical protein